MAARWRVDRNLARSEALLAAEKKIERQRMELQRLVVQAIDAKHTISDIASVTGLGRSTIYKWRDEYAQLSKTFSAPAVDEWTVRHQMSGEFLVAHVVLGEYTAALLGDVVVVWRTEGVYQPITRDGAGWTADHEKMIPEFMRQHEAWVAAGEPTLWLFSETA